MLVGLLDRRFITADCPKCRYPMDIQFLSVRLQEVVYCPCCKLSIQLADDSASSHSADKSISKAMDDLAETLGSLGGTITLEF